MVASFWMTREEVVLCFLESPEAIQKFTNHTYVVMAYLGLLDRAAEQAGFAYHMHWLESQQAAPVDLLAGFVYSPEYLARLAGLGCDAPWGAPAP